MNTPISRRDFINLTLASGSIGTYPTLCTARDRRSEGQGPAFDPVSCTQVSIPDSFWGRKQAKIAGRAIQAIIDQTEVQTGRIRNFEKAARRAGESYEGFYSGDSVVYKTLETIAYSLSYRPNVTLEAKADEWIEKIASAQLSDGYLNTYFTLTGLDKRWTDVWFHEDYCAGHLIEAGVAYYQTTGKRKLLDTAVRVADHIDTTFRVPNRPWISGHEEIELALVKLYRVTRQSRYLELARWYLEQRGRGLERAPLSDGTVDPRYAQSDVPVREQRKITGHAVRAMYLYCGLADVAGLAGDHGYMRALKAIWEDVVYRNMYVTGGIGSSAGNEGFTKDYDLPNASAYCETCASVGMVFWNHRMNALTGEGRYADIMERSLYNGALAGISLSADRFFYTNPLAASASLPNPMGKGRQKWFDVPCCPANIARLISSIAGYIYGVSDRAIWINLLIASNARIKVSMTNVSLTMETNYPWSGGVKIRVEPEQRRRFSLRLRVPGWATGDATPGDLYRFEQKLQSEVQVRVNGHSCSYVEENGYWTVEREWGKGDVVELLLPMPMQAIVAREDVSANRDRVVLQRGPLVYCAEGIDNGGSVWNLVLHDHEHFSHEARSILDEPVITIHSQATALLPTGSGLDIQPQSVALTAVPYYAWANREGYDMQVWLPTRVDTVKVDA